MLFDDLDTASAYRAHVVKRGKQVPAIYTMDGHKLGSDGLLDPKKGSGKMPDSLDYVFGQQPPNSLEEYRIIEEGTMNLSAIPTPTAANLHSRLFIRPFRPI